MKKSILFTLLTILGTSVASAQLLKFGVKAGANFSTLSGADADGFDGLTSFHAGALAEIKIFENFAVQPELLYSSQGAKVEGFEDTKLDYVTVPVLAKFYLITDKLSLEAGPQFAFLVNDNVEALAETKSFDFAAIGGLGFQFTDNVFAQARYVVGLTNTTEDAEIKNTTIQLSLGYRF